VAVTTTPSLAPNLTVVAAGSNSVPLIWTRAPASAPAAGLSLSVTSIGSVATPKASDLPGSRCRRCARRALRTASRETLCGPCRVHRGRLRRRGFRLSTVLRSVAMRANVLPDDATSAARSAPPRSPASRRVPRARPGTAARPTNPANCPPYRTQPSTINNRSASVNQVPRTKRHRCPEPLHDTWSRTMAATPQTFTAASRPVTSPSPEVPHFKSCGGCALLSSPDPPGSSWWLS
jgi:hypothetical protein